jgi:hypothetical protein
MHSQTELVRYALSLLPLMTVFQVACTHSAGTDLMNTVSIPKETTFLDYLPQSAVTGKLSCNLAPGVYPVFAQPLNLENSEWVFVNFKDKPKACEFWQGFVRASALNRDSHQNPQNNQSKTAQLSEEVKQASGGVSDRLLATYGTQSGYNKIEHDVLGWYGEKREGCVAFASTALRSIGEPVPLASLKGDDAISIVTKPFVEFLTDSLGYQRIENLDDAQPGDIGVTVDDKRAPGYPTHVYVFAQWESKADKIARVIDNQGFKHLRPMNRSADPRFVDKDPTVYFLRPSSTSTR